MKNRFWTILSRIMKHEKTQGTLYKASQGFLTYCANDLNIYFAPKRSIETNISENSCFHDERIFGPFSLVLSSVTNLNDL